MKMYIYDLDSMKVIAIAEGETYEECEEKSQQYTNDYGCTYSPAFGTTDGLIDNGDAEIL
jgi:hypothetical protein